MWFIGVKVEQETSAPPPKRNPGSAPGTMQLELITAVAKFWKYSSKVQKSGCTDDFNSFSRGTKILLNTKLIGTNTCHFFGSIIP